MVDPTPGLKKAAMVAQFWHGGMGTDLFYFAITPWCRMSPKQVHAALVEFREVLRSARSKDAVQEAVTALEIWCTAHPLSDAL